MMNISWEHQAHLADGGTPPCTPDPCFYQLTSFHNPAHILAGLSEQLNGALDLAHGTVANVWHIAGRSLQVVYRVPAYQAAGTELIVNVRFLARGTSLGAYHAAIADAGRATIAHLPEWDAIAWLFPSDPQLLQLPAMLDRAGVSARLSRYHGMPIAPEQLSWRLLSYLPGERCAIMYQTASPEYTSIGKLQRGTAAATAHRRMLELSAMPGLSLRIPRPLGVDEALGARWEAYVEGQRLDTLIEQAGFGALIDNTMQALVHLHAAPLAGLPAAGVEQILQRTCAKTMRRIHSTLAGLAPAAAGFFAQLERKAAALPRRLLGTIHGDLHSANILVDRHGPVLIDLDNLALGDPAHDLALLGSRLLLVALHRGMRLADVAGVVESMPAAYAAAGGAPIPERVFAWHLAAMLVGRQIKTCIRHRAPGLERLAPALLRYADETLAHDRFRAAIVRP